MGAEVAVLEAVHEAVGDGVGLGAAGRGDAVAAVAAHIRVKGGDTDSLVEGEGGASGVVPVDVEVPALDLVGRIAPGVVVDLTEAVGRAGRGQRAVQGG